MKAVSSVIPRKIKKADSSSSFPDISGTSKLVHTYLHKSIKILLAFW